MNKKKTVRVAGFVGALALSTVLVTTAIQGTGAYFSDSVGGTLSGSAGHLDLNITGGSTTMSFANLMPGANVTDKVSYSINESSGTADVWLTFDPASEAYAAFTGGQDSPAYTDGGLGRYGYFQVADSNGGTAFTSGNLSFSDGTNTPNKAPSCTTDADGRGGSSWIATKGDFSPTEYCGVPASILLASNLSNGSGGTVSVTFGLNGFMQYDQNQAVPTVPFNLVATQHGVRPEVGNTYKH